MPGGGDFGCGGFPAAEAFLCSDVPLPVSPRDVRWFFSADGVVVPLPPAEGDLEVDGPILDDGAIEGRGFSNSTWSFVAEMKSFSSRGRILHAGGTDEARHTSERVILTIFREVNPQCLLLKRWMEFVGMTFRCG